MEFMSSWRRLSWKAFSVFGAIYLQSVIIYVCSVMQSAFYVTHLVDRGLHFAYDTVSKLNFICLRRLLEMYASLSTYFKNTD